VNFIGALVGQARENKYKKVRKEKESNKEEKRFTRPAPEPS
jgi:hypothetical protein